jgi:hypothetical protein
VLHITLATTSIINKPYHFGSGSGGSSGGISGFFLSL